MKPVKEKFILKVSDDIASVLKNLHPIIKSQIRLGLKAILENPYIGKALKDELKGLRSFRVKRYRIIYRIGLKHRQIEIITIGPRRIIYKETFRILSRNRDS
jgi:mRNA interferase RelE/StbE